MNAAPDPPNPIRSYILRVWCEEDAAAGAWRASLTAIPGGQRVGFSDPEWLLAYLHGERPAGAQYRSDGSSGDSHSEEPPADTNGRGA